MNTSSIIYLKPESIYEQLNELTKHMFVTKDCFEMVINSCTLADLEWNHMDQLHRPTIHKTYEKGIRIATGDNFAISLTKWNKWPMLITVTDVYVARGLFYQSLTIAGIIFIHSIISMETIDDKVRLKHEWYIASHKLFKFLHKFLNKKLHNLNYRLQSEDQQLREGRFQLRKKGYTFKNDRPNYYNSNSLRANTIYPALEEDNACLAIDTISNEPSLMLIGNIEFIVSKDQEETFFIWPAVCPHEGGPLLNGKRCHAKIICPWHGLHFAAAEVSTKNPVSCKFGFEFKLQANKIFVKQNKEN